MLNSRSFFNRWSYSFDSRYLFWYRVSKEPYRTLAHGPKDACVLRRRWRNEVLHDLQQDSKSCCEPQRNLQINEIVIIRDDLSPPGRWPLGRVSSCHPGPDGQVRSVTLKTTSTTLVRPIVKLILLPSNTGSNDCQSEIKSYQSYKDRSLCSSV